MSPPVSAPPPAQPPTSTLHYGHYGPDGQGWPSSSTTGEIKSVPAAPAPSAAYGAPPVDHAGDVRRPVSGQPAFEQAPHQPHQPQQQPYDYDKPYDYDPPQQSALDRVAEQQARQSDQWGYQGQYPPGPYPPASYQRQPEQYQRQPEQYRPEPYQPEQRQQPEQYQPEQYQPDQYQPEQYQPEQYPQEQYQQEPRYWASEPEKPEFDWAAPVQHVSAPPSTAPQQPQQLSAQRVPESDPLVGPLPPVLLGSATAMTAPEPVMPTFADQMSQPAYDPPGLPQRVPAEPDVPPVPAVEAQPVAVGAPELARITNKLREDEDGAPDSPDDRPDGFDVQSVLRAVRTVSGVHRATLRKNADGLHTLRLELADEADAGLVSRIVARMLNETMGLSAEQNPLLPEEDAPPAPVLAAAAPSSSAVVPTARPAARNVAHSALPGYGREARRRRPVSGGRRPAEQKAPALMPNPGAIASPRVVIESVDVSTQGIDATVEVRLTADNQPAMGVAKGPNFDGYVLKLSALAAASAVDQLLIDADTIRARCYIEHAAVVALGGCEVAVVVLLLMYDGFVEQLTGSAVVSGDGDPRQAVVRATLAAVNRRLEALLP
ncbi:hypothetical protein [Dactylosporangium sp. NPDC051484]|uniref:hypothetical protein n=1 Tax=Dactylosporangium sp. NPDC051484 TaxID=3154942 RepID=UPI00344F3373